MGHGRDTNLQSASPTALARRLGRVENGQLASALDEFLAIKIPIQLGGMSDPFMPIERERSVTLDIIRTLRDFKYPYLISTKSPVVSEEPYLKILASSSVIVRFSVTGINAAMRNAVDRGTPGRETLFLAAQRLTQAGVPTAIRIQPLFPGHESEAEALLMQAAQAGIRHVSIEYLKVPLEADQNFGQAVASALGGRPINAFRTLGAQRFGREYTLPRSYRIPHLLHLRRLAHKLGLTVGLADNDLLHLSDGKSCCNGIDIHLPDINVFEANLTGALNNCKVGENIAFNVPNSSWAPERDVSPYFNSRARLPRTEEGKRTWSQYLVAMWEGSYGVHSPERFLGVQQVGRDADGQHIYVRRETEFDH